MGVVLRPVNKRTVSRPSPLRLLNKFHLLPLLTVVVILFASSQGVSGRSLLWTKAAHLFYAARIVPDVIPALAPNFKNLPVAFNRTKVFDGEHLGLNTTKVEPHVDVDKLETYKSFHGYYTLAMVDPDAPGPQNRSLAQVIHWLVTNIPYNLSKSEAISSGGTVLASYLLPTPIIGTHRYTLLLFEQPTAPFLPPPPTSRILFNITTWAKEYNLGDPVAGVFFRATKGEY